MANDRSRDPGGNTATASQGSGSSVTLEMTAENKESTVEVYELSTIDQSIERTYVRLILCFPLYIYRANKDLSRLMLIRDNIYDGFLAAIQRWPFLGGMVCPHSDPELRALGMVQIEMQHVALVREEENFCARTVDAAPDLHKNAGDEWTLYSEWMNPDDDPNKSRPPVTLKACFLLGQLRGSRLLLGFEFHHAVFDGTSINMFLRFFALKCFGQATGGPVVPTRGFHWKARDRIHRLLSASCPATSAGNEIYRAIYGSFRQLYEEDSDSAKALANLLGATFGSQPTGTPTPVPAPVAVMEDCTNTPVTAAASPSGHNRLIDLYEVLRQFHTQNPEGGLRFLPEYSVDDADGSPVPQEPDTDTGLVHVIVKLPKESVVAIKKEVKELLKRTQPADGSQRRAPTRAEVLDEGSGAGFWSLIAEAASRIRLAILEISEVQVVQRLALTPQQIAIIHKTGAYRRAADGANSGVDFSCLRDMLDKSDFMFGIKGTYQPSAYPKGSYPFQVHGNYVGHEGTVKILPRAAGPDPQWALSLTLRATEMEYVKEWTELGDWSSSFSEVHLSDDDDD